MNKLSLIALLSTVSLSAFAVEPCKPYMSINGGYVWGFNTKSNYTTYAANFTFNGPNYVSTLDKQARGMNASFIAGYGFNDAMRAEVGFDWAPKMKSTVNFYNLEVNEMGGHGTIAYDFNNNTAVTPFLFGSLGFVSSKAKITVSTVADSPMIAQAPTGTYYLYDSTDGTLAAAAIAIESKKTDRKTLMTYKVGMGLAMKAGQGVDLEVRYGLGGKPQEWTAIENLTLDTANPTAAAVGTALPYSVKTAILKHMMEHSLTAGVRFTF
jgi:hypothetical protein